MKKPLMIAHRGYSQFEKENTLIAFTAAGAIEEFYGIETDVHVTNDNHFVIIHDEETNRVSDGHAQLNVEKNSFEMVRKVKLTDIDGYTGRVDLRIPEMIEYFRICKKYHKIAVLELKQPFSVEQVQAIIDIIKNIDMLDNTIFISFHLEALLNLRKISKTLKAQWLLGELKDEHYEILQNNNLDVDVLYTTTTKEKIDKCHSLGIKVNIWTVNDQEVANKYAEYGVDFITSNWIKETF